MRRAKRSARVWMGACTSRASTRRMMRPMVVSAPTRARGRAATRSPPASRRRPRPRVAEDGQRLPGDGGLIDRRGASQHLPVHGDLLPCVDDHHRPRLHLLPAHPHLPRRRASLRPSALRPGTQTPPRPRRGGRRWPAGALQGQLLHQLAQGDQPHHHQPGDGLAQEQGGDRGGGDQGVDLRRAQPQQRAQAADEGGDSHKQGGARGQDSHRRRTRARGPRRGAPPSTRRPPPRPRPPAASPTPGAPWPARPPSPPSSARG